MRNFRHEWWSRDIERYMATKQRMERFKAFQPYVQRWKKRDEQTLKEIENRYPYVDFSDFK